MADVPRVPLPNVVEIIAVVLIGIGLQQIYAPLVWIWLGLASFGASFELEMRERRLKRAESQRTLTRDLEQRQPRDERDLFEFEQEQ
ncbi:MAG TPA: hypothetical protein VFA59_06605 [Vicinamibacterales bacterium]|nr:hypothetical protein [Vicinamibacterales bacterium]